MKIVLIILLVCYPREIFILNGITVAKKRQLLIKACESITSSPVVVTLSLSYKSMFVSTHKFYFYLFFHLTEMRFKLGVTAFLMRRF